MILDVLKNSAGDIWEEMLYLIVFNVIWLLGSLLIIPLPFVTFGLFFIVHDIGQGKGIKFSAFFGYARQNWKDAYIWGAINAGILLVLGINLTFYGDIAGTGAQWAFLVRILIVGALILWGVLQLIVLPLYPRLEEPGFRIALRNAAVLLGRHPGPVFMLLVIAVAILVLSVIFPAISFLGSMALIAIVTNRLVEALVEQELKRQT